MALYLPIALDAMGGDKAPEAVIQGARRVLKDFPNTRFIFYGREPVIAPLIARSRTLSRASEVVHAATVIAMDEKPSVALRQGRDSSMRAALDAVAQGKACAMVSAGNTGALMATAKMVLKTLPGIHRPAITATVPSKHRPVVLLDMGANLECTAEYLVQFAIMGDAYARAVMGMAAPRIGLLNVGTEEMKGHDEVKEAHRMLRSGNYPIEYHGFVEGNDILEGTTDVVVTDGFTGNIALKTAEGASRLIYTTLKSAIERSVLAKIGYLFARPAIRMAMKRFDPRKLNGAILLGLNGVAVKSHGGADAKSFANAIKVAIAMAENNVNEKIIAELARVASETPSGVVVPLTAEH
jgi:glycerol-3-phosphate acyltransferase PlsX